MAASAKTTRDEIVSSLRECPLFADLDKSQIQAMATVFRLKRYQTGDHIFRQGDLGDKIYLIREGEVHLERMVDLGTRQAGVTISVLRRHRLVGCWACLLGEHRRLYESAICQKETQVIMTRGSDLKAILDSDPQLNVVMLKRLCQMLGDKIHDAYCAMDAL
jgi:CRP/FNR family cyclic AMP-dependent transcriptional regulator